jgi:hypothetical protein
MPPKRGTRQNVSAENIEALGAAGGAPPVPPPLPENPGVAIRSPPPGRRPSAIPRTPPQAAAGRVQEGFVQPPPVREFRGQRVGQPFINPPPPNYEDIFVEPVADPVPLNPVRNEALQALIGLQHQVLHELQQSRRDRGEDRRTDLEQRRVEQERHDRLLQAMLQQRQEQPQVPNPGNINYPGVQVVNAAQPVNVQPQANNPDVRNRNDIANVAERNRRWIAGNLDELPPPYHALNQDRNVGGLGERQPNGPIGNVHGPANHNDPLVREPMNNNNNWQANGNDGYGRAYPMVPPGFPQAPRPSMHHLKTVEVPKYAGAEEKKTPFDFIVELEKYKTISRSNEEFMLQEIVPASLEGSAYTWYRHEMALAPFAGWEDFKIRFRREFQALGYTEHLYRELDRRTQGPTESLSVFIRVILDYYERLDGHPPEREIVSRIMRQMHPEYLTVLYGKQINTIRELKEAAFQAQDLIKHTRLYQPPPTYHSLEPSLAWQPVEPRPNPPTAPILKPVENRSNPRVHYAAVDPFDYFHPPTTTSNVTFNQASSSAQPINTRAREASSERPLSPRFENRDQRSNSPLPPRENRERNRSGSPDRNPPRCWECQGDHLRSACPRLGRSPQSSGNERSPSPVHRQ